MQLAHKCVYLCVIAEKSLYQNGQLEKLTSIPRWVILSSAILYSKLHTYTTASYALGCMRGGRNYSRPIPVQQRKKLLAYKSGKKLWSKTKKLQQFIFTLTNVTVVSCMHCWRSSWLTALSVRHDRGSHS